MKKLLSMTLALVMGVTCMATLAACGEDNAAIVADVISTLRIRYADQDASTAVSYGVLGEVKVENKAYAVNWSVSSTVEGYADYVSVGSLDATTKLVTINVKKVTAPLEYKLTANVKVGKASDSISFDRVIPESASSEEHAGTLEDPFAAGNVIDIARTLGSGKYYLDEEGNAKKIYVHGYVVDPGRESKAGGVGEGRLGYVYIADTYSEDMTKDSKNTLYVYTLTYDETYIQSAGDLAKGDEVVLWGYIENYSGTPELTYSGDDVVTCVSKKSNRTPEEMIAAALANVSDKFTVSDTTSKLPASSVTGVTFKWAKKSGDFAATVAEDGTITMAELPDEEETIVVTVTASYEGAEDVEKDVTVTIKPIDYGTLKAPISVSATLDIVKDLTTTPGSDVTSKPITAIGVVTSEPSYSTYNNYDDLIIGDVSDPTKTIVVFRAKTELANKEIKKGDTIIVSGFVKNYNGTLEFANANSTDAMVEANYGSLTHPLSVAETLALVEDFVPNDVTAGVVYAVGVITNIKEDKGTYYSEVTIADLEDDEASILIYSVSLRDGIEAIEVGDTVVVSGYIKNYNDLLEFASNSGRYVYVESIGLVAEEAPEGLLYTLTTDTVTGSNNSYAGNCDMEVDGVTWNLEGNSQMNPWRLGGKSITDQDRKLTGKTAITGTVSELKISFGANSGSSITVNSVTLKVYKVDPTGTGATAAYTKTITNYAANTTVTVTPGEGEDWTDCYYQLVFNVTVSGSSNAFVTVTKMEFYGE